MGGAILILLAWFLRPEDPSTPIQEPHDPHAIGDGPGDVASIARADAASASATEGIREGDPASGDRGRHAPQVRVRLTGAERGEGVRGVTVDVTSPQDPAFRGTAVTDIDGLAVVPFARELPSQGHLRIHARDASGISLQKKYGVASITDAVIELEVLAGPTLLLELPCRGLEGRKETIARRALAGARSRNAEAQRVIWDEQPWVRFPYLRERVGSYAGKDHAYRIQLDSLGTSTAAFGYTDAHSGVAPVALTCKEIATLAGTVVDNRGSRVEGALVQLVGANDPATELPEVSGGHDRHLTNAEGEFRFGWLEPGDYVLEVRAPGFAAARFGHQSTESGPLVLRLTATGGQHKTVTGVLHAPWKLRPEWMPEVSLHDPDDGRFLALAQFHIVDERRAQFVVDGVPRREIEITVWPKRGDSEYGVYRPESLRVASGEELVEFRMAASDTGIVQYDLSPFDAQGGQPVEQFTFVDITYPSLTYLSKSKSTFSVRSSDPSGKARTMGYLRETTARWVVMARDFQPTLVTSREATGDVDAGRAASIELELERGWGCVVQVYVRRGEDYVAQPGCTLSSDGVVLGVTDVAGTAILKADAAPSSVLVERIGLHVTHVKDGQVIDQAITNLASSGAATIFMETN